MIDPWWKSTGRASNAVHHRYKFFAINLRIHFGRCLGTSISSPPIYPLIIASACGEITLTPNKSPAAMRMITTPSASTLAHPRADQFTHDLAIVDQHVQKKQRRRHGQNSDHIYQQNDVHQRNSRNQYQSGGGRRFEKKNR